MGSPVVGEIASHPSRIAEERGDAEAEESGVDAAVDGLMPLLEQLVDLSCSGVN